MEPTKSRLRSETDGTVLGVSAISVGEKYRVSTPFGITRTVADGLRLISFSRSRSLATVCVLHLSSNCSSDRSSSVAVRWATNLLGQLRVVSEYRFINSDSTLCQSMRIVGHPGAASPTEKYELTWKPPKCTALNRPRPSIVASCDANRGS